MQTKISSVTLADKWPVDAMTSLQGEMDCSYKSLVDLFGEPNSETDGYKIDAEWMINTPFGFATIYNYKTGKNYNGDDGDEVEDIRDWHIGAQDTNPAVFLSAIVQAYELKK